MARRFSNGSGICRVPSGFARPVLAVLVVVIGAVTAAPAAGRLEGSIAYRTFGADSSSVYTVRPDGTGSRRVLEDAHSIELSRDGRQLAYARGDYGNQGLWTADADGTDRRQVVDPARPEPGLQSGNETWSPREPSWSPDGKRIAFEASWEVDRGVSVSEENRVVTVGATGGALRVLADGGNPAWSPRGNVIAYTTDVGGTEFDNWNRIAVIRSDGKRRRFVVRSRKWWRNGLDFSPSGRRLLYEEHDFQRNRARLRVLDVRTGRRMTVIKRQAPSAVWTSSDRWIAYVHFGRTPTGKRTHVRIIRRNGTGDRRLFSLPFDEQGRDLGAEELSWRTRR